MLLFSDNIAWLQTYNWPPKLWVNKALFVALVVISDFFALFFLYNWFHFALKMEQLKLHIHFAPHPHTWIVIPSQVFSTGLLWKTPTYTHLQTHQNTSKLCRSLWHVLHFSWSAQWIMCLFLFGIRPKAFLDHHCSMVSKQTNNIYKKSL
jgi:hypothetical protein